MLVISPGQMQSLAVPHHAAFVARVREFLHRQTPELVERPDLDARIESGLAEAGTLGIAGEQEQVLYVVLALLHGPGFTKREPWARPVVEAHRAAFRETGLAHALMDASAAAFAPRG